MRSLPPRYQDPLATQPLVTGHFTPVGLENSNGLWDSLQGLRAETLSCRNMARTGIGREAYEKNVDFFLIYFLDYILIAFLLSLSTLRILPYTPPALLQVPCPLSEGGS